MGETAVKTFAIEAPAATLIRFRELSDRQRGQLLEMFERYAAGDPDAIQHLVDRADPHSAGVAVHHSTAATLRIMSPERP